MKNKCLLFLFITLFIITIVSISCGDRNNNSSIEKNDTNLNPNVICHLLTDAQNINPMTYTGFAASHITSEIFYSLLAIDFNTLELVPVVASSRPEIEKTIDGGMRITYNIRPEAKWDNGESITAKDVEFTLKVIKNPKVDNANSKPYYEFIKDITFYNDDPLKFTFIVDKVYILAEISSADMPLLQKGIYDPKGLMDEFSIKDLSKNGDKLADNMKIIEFANEFNSEKYQRDKNFISGCGPYKLVEWQTGQKLVIAKKENWWGDQLKKEGMFFDIHPPKIIYQTINDQTTAKEAIKGGKIDVMNKIKSKDFNELLKSKKFTNNFNAHTPPFMAYTYLGINIKKPMFSNKKTRKALAHLVNIDQIIDAIMLEYAEKAIGPIHPSKKKQYNNNISPYEYNPKKAKELLSEAGWKDTDKDGVLDNVINGKKIKFEMSYLYNQGNDARKAIGLLFQEEARKVGIIINIVSQDWSLYLENTKNHKFDIYSGAWASTTTPSDHKQIYHTTSYHGGSNHVGFGNEISDALIDSIRVELDEDKRAILNHKFQQILHDECAHIYMYYPLEKIAIHKRFSNAKASVLRPGFRATGFTVNQPIAK